MTRLLAVLLAASAVPSIPAMAGDLQAEAAPAAAVDEDREFGYFQAYMQAYQAGDYAGMAEALVRFKGQPLISKQAYDATRNATRSLEHAGELLPSDAFDQVQWLQGSADLGGAQLLVFAEQWCPHCRREVPGLPAFAAEHQLDLVLLTRLSHSSTEEKMMAWVAEAGLTGPVGKTSSLADSLGVRGVPASVLVRDGRVLWQGHPALLTREGPALITTLLDKKATKRAIAARADIEAAIAMDWPPVDGPPPGADEAARELLQAARMAMADARWNDARVSLRTLREQHPQSAAQRSAQGMQEELDTIGRVVPAAPFTPLVGTLNWPPTEPTVVVFWEAWCPHCRREVPKLGGLAQRFEGRADVVGFTKLSRSSTRESALAFLEEHTLTVPMAVEAGDISTTFGVSGVPAAAVVREGRIVWRGHPARLSDDLLGRVLTTDLTTLLPAEAE